MQSLGNGEALQEKAYSKILSNNIYVRTISAYEKVYRSAVTTLIFFALRESKGRYTLEIKIFF